MTSKRHREILAMAARDGEVSVDALARRFGVSVMTIRRDLTRLAREGKVSRTHGGALPARAAVLDLAYEEKARRRAGEKRAIARAVAEMIRPGMAISLDTGTTTLEVARAISHMEDLTVLTTSLVIAFVLRNSEGIEPVLLGGAVRKNSPDLTGELTEDNIKRFHVHLAVLGADAVKPDGVYTTDARIARVSRAMIVNADQVVLAADSSKFMQTAFVRCVGLNDLDRIVTDDGCPQKVRRWIERSVKTVTYARVE
ncbi:MAG: DeoR/GlpR family DNA-binding transcription regulator [Planctomycetota bacterium]